MAKRFPRVACWYRHLLEVIEARRLRHKSAEEVFTDIFHRNYWGATSSRSGTGSDLTQARVLVRELAPLVARLQVRSLLDLPCGDFHWMKDVDLGGVTYVGADIVAELIERNRRLYERPGRTFVQLNVFSDPLPRVDLILCRDCLVHFSLLDAQTALHNIAASGARYLLTTTFPERPVNRDITTGQWRPINLQAAPFNLPPPLQLISEQCTEDEGAYPDKSLGLWSVLQVDSAFHD
jgi:hypothetical protein